MGVETFDFTGKVAKVTGNTWGLGEIEVMALAEARADIGVCGFSETHLERGSKAIKGLGKSWLVFYGRYF